MRCASGAKWENPEKTICEVFCAHGQKSHRLRTDLIGPSWKFRSEIAPSSRTEARGEESCRPIISLCSPAKLQPSNTIGRQDSLRCASGAKCGALRSETWALKSRKNFADRFSGIFSFRTARAPRFAPLAHRAFRRGGPEDYTQRGATTYDFDGKSAPSSVLLRDIHIISGGFAIFSVLGLSFFRS